MKRSIRKFAGLKARKWLSSSVIKLLVKRGANRQAMLIGNGATILYRAAQQGRCHAVNLLTEGGADPNDFHWNTGNTSVREATLAGHREIVRLLLSAGRKPEAWNHQGWRAAQP